MKRIQFAFIVVSAFAFLLAAVEPARAADPTGQNSCLQPISTNAGPSVTDCLATMHAVVGSRTCSACVCDGDGSGAVTASDVALCLAASTRQQPTLACPVCEGGADTEAGLAVATTFPSTTSSTWPPTTFPGTTTTTLINPGDVSCDIEFGVPDDVGPVGAVQFDVDYSSASGNFVGSGGDVVCVATVGDFSAFNDMDASRTLAGAMISLAGFATPTSVASCQYRGPAAPAAADFALTVTDASAPDLSPLNLTVVVQSIGCTLCATDQDCDDGDFCTGVETCNPALGCMPGTAVNCDDGNACTADSCDPVSGCVHDDISASCDDGQFCNGKETCDSASGCVAGTALPIDDGVECTLDTCDEAADVVRHTPDDTACDDTNVCTDDVCDAAIGCRNVFDPTNDTTCSEVVTGKMTGGGRFYGGPDDRDRITHGFRLMCDPSRHRNRLRIVWKRDRQRSAFRLRQVTSAICGNDPTIGPEPPRAGFDTHEGEGRGTLRQGRVKTPGATVKWRFIDGGEPSVDDDVSFLVLQAQDGTILMFEVATSFNGNHKAHR